jgi:hypothetical protein
MSVHEVGFNFNLSLYFVFALKVGDNISRLYKE